MFHSSSIQVFSRILNWSISFCRCMLSSKHGIVIILNLSNFIFPQFWPEIVEKGSILNIAILSNKKFLKTCSCPFVQYFCTLFWDDTTIIWDENIVYFFNLEKNLFWTNKNICLLNFHQQIIVISSQNYVQKYRTYKRTWISFQKSYLYQVHNFEQAKQFESCFFLKLRISQLWIPYFGKGWQPLMWLACQ